MTDDRIVKEQLQSAILEGLSAVDDVISVTLVGSFVDKQGLAGISDIDTVVICRKLTRETFDACRRVVEGLDLSRCGLSGYQVRVNDTFGPLKFDAPRLVVIHLMVYDAVGHFSHVVNSPFTCLDWERSAVQRGLALRDIFPVGALQPRDFAAARRGINDYLADLADSTVSYRYYDFHIQPPAVVTAKHPVDRRARGEYAFHIFRNLISNLLKLVSGRNERFEDADLVESWRRHLPRSARHIESFRALSAAKHAGNGAFPEDAGDWARRFVADFESDIDSLWSDAIVVRFVRHAATDLNDGSFLGQRRDPPVSRIRLPSALPDRPALTFISQALRCKDTAAALVPGCTPNIDPRLNELDYGQAEGMTLAQLRENYPAVTDAWARRLDGRFPGGENTADVLARLRSFINDLGGRLDAHPQPALVVTHCGILRCLIGDAFGLDMTDWYRLTIPHSEPLEFLWKGGRLYPNIPRPLVAAMLHPLLSGKST